jgi:hypothetical protein
MSAAAIAIDADAGAFRHFLSALFAAFAADISLITLYKISRHDRLSFSPPYFAFAFMSYFHFIAARH